MGRLKPLLSWPKDSPQDWALQVTAAHLAGFLPASRWCLAGFFFLSPCKAGGWLIAVSWSAPCGFLMAASWLQCDVHQHMPAPYI